ALRALGFEAAARGPRAAAPRRVSASGSCAHHTSSGHALYPTGIALSLRAPSAAPRRVRKRRRRTRRARAPMEDTRNRGAPAAQRMPPEWAPHTATWLSWPHNRETWPGCFEGVEPAMAQAAAALAETEHV